MFNLKLYPSAGERISAQEAERMGLVSKVFPVDQLVDEAVKLGEKIAGMSQVTVAMAKEAVNAANNLPLDEGKGTVNTSAHAAHALWTLFVI